MMRLMLLGSGAYSLGQDRAPSSGSSVNLDDLQFKAEPSLRPVEAMFWEKQPQDKKVKCTLCPHECVVADMERGTCGVRENRDGTYYTLVHSRLCAAHLDPIEKKPLFHYLPGTKAFSIATPGCNLECKYCQNWQISQFRPEQIECIEASPEVLVANASRNAAPTIAFTYTEPVIFYEYMYDIAVAARPAGIGSVMITSGFINREPLRKLIPELAAIKVDFKGFTDEFYRTICGGELQPVLDALVTIRREGLWLELVVLIVPTLNDSIEENRKMFHWIKDNLGSHVPLHLSRFHPTYKLKNLPATPVSTLERLHSEARDAGLNYVYLGNVQWGHPAENTYCHSCGKMLIRRYGFQVVENHLDKGHCPHCRQSIPGVFTKS
ncbi:MAG: AmmeMemoRadiSam system radical SAM enzyme [Acidobacteria bacterium]|nr:AmmeMemoRadiSam system radical SAM enzyme [Acidobacteriota bacterium]